MNKSKTLVIFNPAANRGHASEMEKSLQEMDKQTGEINWKKTTKPGESKAIAEAAIREGYQHIIAIGGDGTTAEVVNGMLVHSKEKRPTLSIVPVGSGNDFSGSLGISSKPAEAFSAALTGQIHPIDIGMMQINDKGKYFWVNVVGIGFDAVVDIHTRTMPIFSGFWLYFASAIQTILQNHIPYQLTGKIDGKPFEKILLMLIISNGKREGGGFKIAPLAQLNDGELNYVGVSEISRIRMLMTLPYFLQGTQDRLPYVESGSLKSMEVRSDRPMQIHADGEIIAGLDSRVTSIKIQILPSAISVIY
jgi:diacylglycerol kinase (ATP)